MTHEDEGGRLPYIHRARTPHGTHTHTTTTTSIHMVPKTAATGARQHHPPAIATGGDLPVYQSSIYQTPLSPSLSLLI